ncbi:MAG: metal ABC transporter substrate-binding protein [Myxococcota bacterium]
MAHTSSERARMRQPEGRRGSGRRLGWLLASLCLALGLGWGAPFQAGAALRVFTCEPEWASLAQALGGDHVHVDSATTPFQDVHYIQARPSLIAKVRRADLLVCSGAELEIGWLPVLLRQARNGRIQPGSTGYLEASRYVPMLDVPSRVDRAQGDIHPYGNPHIQTDPRNVARVAEELASRLEALDPDHRADYRARYDAFAQRWQAAMSRWRERAAPLRGMEIVTHHLAWVYLAHWLGLRVVAHLEPKPGIPPSAGHLAQLVQTLARHPVRVIVRAVYQDAHASEWLSRRTGAPALVLPHCVGATDDAGDLYAMFDTIVDRLLEARG